MERVDSGQNCISRKTVFGILFIITATMIPMLNAGYLLAGGPENTENVIVPGIVKKTGGSLIAVKTEVGTTRYITRSHVEKKGMAELSAGDRVLLVLDSGNLVVDIHSRGISSVRGTVETIRVSDKLLTIRLQNGRIRDYGLKDNVLPNLDRIRKGTLITFEIDKQDRIMAFRIN